MASIRGVAPGAIAVFMPFAMSGVVYWALIAICGAGCVNPRALFEPVAGADDVAMVEGTVQSGLANVAADIQAVGVATGDVATTVNKTINQVKDDLAIWMLGGCAVLFVCGLFISIIVYMTAYDHGRKKRIRKGGHPP